MILDNPLELLNRYGYESTKESDGGTFTYKHPYGHKVVLMYEAGKSELARWEFHDFRHDHIESSTDANKLAPFLLDFHQHNDW